MRNKVSTGEYLAFLSVKHDVDPDKFYFSILSAVKNNQSKCGDLIIECRGKQHDNTILLITKDSKVVAQFPVDNHFLLERNNPIKRAIKSGALTHRKIKDNNGDCLFQIADLRIGMKKVKLKAKILEMAEPTSVFTRFGNYANVTNALIEDETGVIKLCLWNDQIKSLSLGDTVQVENARVSAFRGEKQLRIGKNGSITVMTE